YITTQKPLMVQPNAPRFFREGDNLEFSAKVVNMSDTIMKGTAHLQLADAVSGKNVDGWFKNIFPSQHFSVEPGMSQVIKFPFSVPVNFNSSLVYTIRASTADGTFNDGEEAAVPVLTNRMLVTETLPLNMRREERKTFSFDKLLQSSNSSSLTHHALTVEYTSNPAWYVIQALPYLMEYPYDCSEQVFNRYYANAVAANIVQQAPRIREIFEKWRITDTAALMSNLQKNTELKSVLLQETPWVLQAENEQKQKANIAMLFDLIKLSAEQEKTLEKLKALQIPNGGFSWFKGGRDDRFITQYIVTGIGRLNHLGALGNAGAAVNEIVVKALPYLDARISDEYNSLLKLKTDLKKDHLSNFAIQYLYMRSFFPDVKIPAGTQKAHDYFKKQSGEYWLNKGKYMQAMIAITLFRDKNVTIPDRILTSLRQNAINSPEMGTYWKDIASGGYYWHQAPIESHSLIIAAFSEIKKNDPIIDEMKTWLLKNKQTNNWRTTKATADACYALLLQGTNWLNEEKTVKISLG
ncbi:MAG: alpha-2-macroglobulin, partial [Chitinophagaceae bacterium]